jgi:flagellar motility protein MotE (MotC chaperone)
MKSGYQQFFKQAKQVAKQSALAGVKSQAKSPRSKDRVSTGTQEITNQLRERMKQKVNRPANKIPWTIVGISLVGVVVAFAGLNYSTDAEKFFKRIEFSLMGIASAEEAHEAKVAASQNEVKPTEAKRIDRIEEGATAKKEFSDEEINHFSKLNERKRELDAREEELSRVESELAIQKSELEKRMTELDSTRKQISGILDEKVKADDKKVDVLVQVYTSMKPQQAAKILETMDEDLAVEILGRMKRKPAAEVLNLLKPEKAQVLSEKYSGYKKH